MIRDYLKSYFEKQRKQIKEVLALKDLPSQPKAIHDLRMAFKRSRALFKLLDALSKGEFDKRNTFDKLGKLYKAFGKVRDLHVHEQLTKDIEEELDCEYPELKKLLKSHKSKAQDNLGIEIKAFSSSSLKTLKGEVSSSLRSFKDSKVLKRVDELMSTQFKLVGELLADVSEDKDNFHRIRTLLKELYYVIAIVQDAQGEEIWPERLVYRLDQCIEEAGEWHDRELLLEFLKTIRAKDEGTFLKSGDYRDLRKFLKEDLQSRSDTLAYEIKSLLKTYRKYKN